MGDTTENVRHSARRKWSDYRSAADAPAGLSEREAQAWAAGWNAAIQAATEKARAGRERGEAERAERVRLGLDD